MNQPGHFAGTGSRFGVARLYDARLEGMRHATVVEEPGEVGNVTLNGERDPRLFHKPQLKAEYYHGYENARCVG